MEGVEEEVFRMVARVHRLCVESGVCYMVIGAEVDEKDVVHTSFNFKKESGCSDFFGALVYYWIQLNYRSFGRYENEVLRGASVEKKTTMAVVDEQRKNMIRTLLTKIWQHQDIMKHKFVIIYAELDFLETLFFTDVQDDRDVPPAIWKGIEIIKERIKI
jgi:hypothetical protein